jgi:hypothetical protein
MLVRAKCLQFAWDSTNSKAYHPDGGPLPDGLYEIDEDSQLTTLKTIRGDWIFQYPGHEGKAPKTETDPIVSVKIPEMVSVPHSDTVIKERVSGSRGKPLSAAHKAKLAAGREAARVRKAELAAA